MRIYERENLDHDLTVHELHTTSLCYILIEGYYVDSKNGMMIQDLSANVVLEEEVKSL